MSLFQRIADWRRERRIRALRVEIADACIAHDTEARDRLCRALFAECDQRSEGQKRRMTDRFIASLDPHARAVFQKHRVE